jgi:hypothetical protein
MNAEPPLRDNRGKRRGHHRRPTSINGNARGANVSFPPHDIHTIWHELVFNMCAPKVATLLDSVCMPDGYAVTITRSATTLHPHECPEGVVCPIHCGLMMPYGVWLRTSLERTKEMNWVRLRGAIATAHSVPGLTETEVAIDYINAMLIDPDYWLIVRKRE